MEEADSKKFNTSLNSDGSSPRKDFSIHGLLSSSEAAAKAALAASTKQTSAAIRGVYYVIYAPGPCGKQVLKIFRGDMSLPSMILLIRIQASFAEGI